MKRVLTFVSIVPLFHVECSNANFDATNSKRLSNEISASIDVSTTNLKSPNMNEVDFKLVRDQPIGGYFSSICVICHAPNREKLVDPALLPSTLELMKFI